MTQQLLACHFGPQGLFPFAVSPSGRFACQLHLQVDMHGAKRKEEGPEGQNVKAIIHETNDTLLLSSALGLLHDGTADCLQVF